jgi:hypothetical protein
MTDKLRDTIAELNKIKMFYPKSSEARNACERAIICIKLIEHSYDDLILIEEELNKSGYPDHAIVAHRILWVLFNNFSAMEHDRICNEDKELLDSYGLWMK